MQEGTVPEVPPGQGMFLRQPPWFAPIPPEGVPGMWIGHLGPREPLLRTEGISANLFL